jgi:hypothetical protein
MRISVRTLCRNMYKQLREKENTTHTRKGLCCVAFVMAFRKRNGTSQQALKTDLPPSVGGCGMGGDVDGPGMT